MGLIREGGGHDALEHSARGQVAATEDLAPLRFSIVVEWDNARAHDIRRAAESLKKILGQAVSLHGLAALSELIIAFDAVIVERTSLEAIIAPDLAPAGALVLLPCPGQSYYALKNAGAAHATGDVVVFADSDVAPEDGWLESLLAPFRDSAVHVACGSTYLRLGGVYAKAFALFWIFPLRAPDGECGPTQRFFANNVAFRRAVFLRNPFPSVPAYKDSCARLASRLTNSGINIWLVPGARMAHLPPQGVGNFARRALAHGYDYWSRDNLHPRSSKEGLKNAYWRFRASLRHARRRILVDGPRVGLRSAQAPVAFGVALAYFAIAFLGEALCLWRPDFLPRSVRL